MTKTYKTAGIFVGAILNFGFSHIALAQDNPVAVSSGSDVGFHLPLRSGSVTYGISASQTTIFGYNGNTTGGNVTSTNVSGDLAYVSNSERRPFSLVYSGGFLGSESSQLPSSSFQNLSLSQVWRARNDSFVIADTVSYLPESPTVGLSGIAGLGDLGVAPVQVGAYAGPGILTQFQTRVSNVVSASDTHSFTGSTSVHGTVDYAIQRFLGDFNQNLAGSGVYGYNSNQFGVGGGVLHRIDARNSIGGNYNFEDFTYVGNPYSFRSNSVTAEYIYRFSPRLTFDGMGGPQWSSSSAFSSTYLNGSAALSLTYVGERGNAQLAYTRGTNTGSGVVAGAIQDTVGFNATHRFMRTVSGSTTVSYSRSSSLPNVLFAPFSFDTELASVQVTKGLGRNLSVYGSYTLENQSTQNSGLTPLIFNGRSQILGFGVTYSPDSLRIRR